MFVRFMRWLDGHFLAAAQKFCDEFQRLTGLTKFRLQKWTLVLSLVFLWLAVFSFDPRWHRLLIPFVLASLINIVAGALFFWLDDEAEAIFLVSGRLVYSPRFSVLQRFATIYVYGAVLVLAILLPDTTGLLLFCYGALYIAFMYFSACVPRPPGTSRVQECYEWALAWLDSKYAPLP